MFIMKVIKKADIETYFKYQNKNVSQYSNKT